MKRSIRYREPTISSDLLYDFQLRLSAVLTLVPSSHAKIDPSILQLKFVRQLALLPHGFEVQLCLGERHLCFLSEDLLVIVCERHCTPLCVILLRKNMAGQTDW